MQYATFCRYNIYVSAAFNIKIKPCYCYFKYWQQAEKLNITLGCILIIRALCLLYIIILLFCLDAADMLEST